MAQTETLYILEVKAPDEDPQRIPVQGKISMGSSGDVDLCYMEAGLAPRHCTFRDNNEVLTVQNTGGEGAVVVGKQDLSHGKMYIVDKGDSIKIGDITVIIRTEEAEVEYEEDYEDDGDHTSPQKEGRSFVETITNLFKRTKKEQDEDEEEIDVQVIDHTEDDEEVDEDEDTSPAREIKASGALGAIKPKSVKVSPFTKERRAGAIVRTIGFMVNIASVYGFYLYAIPALKLEEHFQKVYDLLIPHIEKLTPLVSAHIPENILVTATSYTVIKILIIFVVLELVSALLFGCSLGLFLIGVTGHGGFISKRLRAVMRSVWGLVTSPLIITEIPALLKYRTLKEVLSFSQLEKRSNILSIVLCGTMAPAAILAVILWPMAMDPFIIQNPEYEVVQKAPKRKGKKPANFVSTSRYFNLKTGFFKKPTIHFLPSAEKRGPVLYGLDVKKGNEVTIRKSKEIDLNEIFKSMLEMNPFFPSFTPNLYNFMANQKSNALVSDEIAALTRDAFGLTPMRLHEVLLDHGPYVNGLMDLRNKLISSLGINSKFKTTSLQIARKPYVIIEEESTSAKQSLFLIQLGAMKITPVIMEFKSKDRIVANYVLENVFKKSSSLSKKFSFSASSVEEWNALTILDLYTVKPEEISEEIASAVTSFYGEKLEVLKNPEGLSVKSKKVLTKALRNTLRKTSAQYVTSPLGESLKILSEDLPKSEKKPKAKK